MSAKPIAVIQKNKREEIRIGLDEYKGHPLVSMRVWVVAEDLPTRKGIAFNPALLPEVIAALETAHSMWEAEQ